MTLEEIRAEFQRRCALAPQRARVSPEVVYDEIFEAGTAWLNELSRSEKMETAEINDLTAIFLGEVAGCAYAASSSVVPAFLDGDRTLYIPIHRSASGLIASNIVIYPYAKAFPRISLNHYTQGPYGLERAGVLFELPNEVHGLELTCTWNELSGTPGLADWVYRRAVGTAALEAPPLNLVPQPSLGEHEHEWFERGYAWTQRAHDEYDASLAARGREARASLEAFGRDLVEP